MQFTTDLSSMINLFVKWLFIIAALLYVLFSGVITRQISLMTRNVFDKFNTLIVFLGWLYFGIGIFVLLLTLLIL